VRLRPRRRAVLAQPFSRLPRGNWQRRLPRRELRAMASEADVLYLHGLHVMHLGAGLALPVVAHEVDPWSEYWQQRAAGLRGPRRWYDLVQQRRAARLERSVAGAGATLVVVNENDAASLRRSSGGRVVALPNGVEQAAAGAVVVPEEPVLVFVGTLDYPPNVEAVTRLAAEVWPRVRAAVPTARLVVAGRHPAAEVLAVAGEGIEVVGAVDDVAAVFRQARAAVYAGVTGRGTKNSVTESLMAGCPVVASPESARGQLPGPHLLVGADAEALASHAVTMLTDAAACGRARAACVAMHHQVRSWRDAATEMAALLHEAGVR
ncbi:MAG: glycosyltransferase, partial [Nocardioidaceae bacterium]